MLSLAQQRINQLLDNQLLIKFLWITEWFQLYFSIVISAFFIYV